MEKKVLLNLISLKCVNETGTTNWGSDEISLGGFAIDSKAKTTKITPFNVSSDFDNGEMVKYTPHKNFTSFTLGTNLKKPVTFSAGFLLIERDNGGMDTATKKIYDKVVAEIKKKKEELESRIEDAGQVVIAGIPIGLIWTFVKPIVYGYVKDKIIGWFGDDLFPMRDVSVTIPNENHTWHGKKTSPPTMIEFRGNDGIYQLVYEWEIK